MKSIAVIFSISTLTLLGCASMSGYDARSSFSCKAPDGILCESMSGIYASAQAKNLPSQHMREHGETLGELSHAANLALAVPKGDVDMMTKPLHSGTPIRSAPRLLRVWFAPWEDTDGDLHDQSYVYLSVDSGRWLIEHNYDRIQYSYQPVRAPSTGDSQTPGALLQTPLESLQDHTVQHKPHGVDPSASSDHGQESIGVRQDRMSNEKATELLSGIKRPGD